MGNCLGSEEAELEVVKNPGHHGRQPQAAATAARAMAAPKSERSMSSPGPRSSSRSPGSSMNSTTTTTTGRSRSGSTSSGGGSRPLASPEEEQEQEEAREEGRILETPDLRIFTFAELKAATRNFKPDTVLGEGGFGRVYKGWVDEKTMNPTRSGIGMVVAVKKLNPESVQGMQEWQAEVNFMGRLSHPNLVKLLGYCVEDRELLLVYEYMPKGSLDNHLFRKGGNVRTILVEPSAAHRHWRGAWPRLPPLVGKAGDLPGLQGLEHPARHELQRQALRLWSRQERPDRRRQPRHHPGHGHVRLRCAGVRRHRAPVREERRVRLRRGAAGDADGPEGAGHGPARAAAQPGGVGQAVPGGPAEAGAPGGPAARGPVPVQGGAAGGPAHAALPRGGPQEPALHGGGRAGPRGDRAAQGPAQGRRAKGPGRSSAERARPRPRPRAVVAAEVRAGKGGEQQQPPPVSEHEVARLPAAQH